MALQGHGAAHASFGRVLWLHAASSNPSYGLCKFTELVQQLCAGLRSNCTALYPRTVPRIQALSATYLLCKIMCNLSKITELVQQCLRCSRGAER